MESEDEKSPNETLPKAPPDRLALDNPVLLAMMPIAARPAVSAVWRFDAAMAGIVARAAGGEAMLAQLRLAWWRDEIAELSRAKARPDPVLAALAEVAPITGESALEGLLSAWEALLLAHPFDASEAIRHADRRGQAIEALTCAVLDVDVPAGSATGRSWAATDLALHVGDPDIRAALFDHVACAPNSATDAPRAMRALAGWSQRIAARQGRPAPLSDQLYLLRMGMIGC